MSKIRLHGTSSGYTEIVPKAAAASNTLTAPSTVGEIIAKDAAGAIGITSAKTDNINVGAAVTITASGIEATGVGVTVASINSGQLASDRNMVINGAMNIAQRGTAASTANQRFACDRFKLGWSGANEAITSQQVALTSSDTGPWEKGLRNCFKITNGNQTSGADAADYVGISYRNEGYDLRSCGWAYDSATSYITLSFWAKASVAQTYYVWIKSADGTAQDYNFSFTLAANTWKYITHTIPGGTNVEFDWNNGEALRITWMPFFGTDYTASGQAENVWKAYASGTRTADQTSTWWTTNDATWQLTGVQLEVGSVATPFEHRRFGNELEKCLRYFEKSYPYTVEVGANSSQGMCCNRYTNSVGNRMDLSVRWRGEKRSTPTVVIYSKLGTSGEVSNMSSSSTTFNDAEIDGVFHISKTGHMGIDMTSGTDDIVSYHYTADSEI